LLDSSSSADCSSFSGSIFFGPPCSWSSPLVGPGDHRASRVLFGRLIFLFAAALGFTGPIWPGFFGVACQSAGSGCTEGRPFPFQLRVNHRLSTFGPCLIVLSFAPLCTGCFIELLALFLLIKDERPLSLVGRRPTAFYRPFPI